MQSNQLRYYSLIISSLLFLGVIGCSKEESISIPPSTKNSYAKSDLTASFGEKLKLSRQLVSYIEEAKNLVSSGRYSDALIAYKKADALSSDRATKTMINEGFAETYLLLRDYQMAVLYFEKAADSTMNVERAKEFSQKAKESRQNLA